MVRFVATDSGVHVRVTVFTAANKLSPAFEKIGDLTMRPDEWLAFRVLITAGPIDSDIGDGVITVETVETIG